ncbi:MAG: 6,7-dimethyl-8-ribityllumazine synthase [Vulcanimicrobiaceae bacterium]
MGIVSARFYDALADWLEAGAHRALDEAGIARKRRGLHRVPGCFELPLAARLLFERERYDAVVALGVVIRGETPHFEYVAGECARGLMDVQLAVRRPIGFGVLTTETLPQAEERADPARGNKGYDAARAALALLRL